MRSLSTDLLALVPRLRRYARVLTDDPALADALVEQVLALARQITDEGSMRMAPQLRLFSMLRSACADELAQRPSPLPGAIPAKWGPGNGSAGEPGVGPGTPRGDELLVHLYRLPLEQREVLVLVAVERMPYEDIATLLAVPVATVLARMIQAREALRTAAPEPLSTPKGAG